MQIHSIDKWMQHLPHVQNTPRERGWNPVSHNAMHHFSFPIDESKVLCLWGKSIFWVTRICHSFSISCMLSFCIDCKIFLHALRSLSFSLSLYCFDMVIYLQQQDLLPWCFILADWVFSVSRWPKHMQKTNYINILQSTAIPDLHQVYTFT